MRCHLFATDLHHLFPNLVEVGGDEDLLTIDGDPRSVLTGV